MIGNGFFSVQGESITVSVF